MCDTLNLLKCTDKSIDNTELLHCTLPIHSTTELYQYYCTHIIKQENSASLNLLKCADNIIGNIESYYCTLPLHCIIAQYYRTHMILTCLG